MSCYEAVEELTINVVCHEAYIRAQFTICFGNFARVCKRTRPRDGSGIDSVPNSYVEVIFRSRSAKAPNGANLMQIRSIRR